VIQSIKLQEINMFVVLFVILFKLLIELFHFFRLLIPLIVNLFIIFVSARERSLTENKQTCKEHK